MGFVFTLIYILGAYLAPQTVFGGLADYRAEVYVAVIATLLSVASLQGSGLFEIPQTIAILGLILSVVLSTIFAGLTREAPTVFMDVTTSIITFFLIVVNCKKIWQLKTLVAMLIGIGLFIVLKGYFGLATGDLASPYVLSMSVGGGDYLLRIRGLSFLNDPNDLSQFIVSIIPCAFLFWKKGRYLLNSVLVLLPISILLFGMYLSHSRGGMIALIAAAIVAGRRKIGVIPAIVIGGILFVGLSAVGWGGGRDVSAASGMERMEAWSTGMQLIRAHPIFGVGYQRFNEFYYITAHNTVIVVAAELGMFGLFFFMLFVFPTIRDAVAGSGDKKSKAAKLAAAEDHLPVGAPRPSLAGAPQIACANAGLSPSPLHMRRSRHTHEPASTGTLDRESTPTRSATRSTEAAGMPLGFIREMEEIPIAELERMSGLMMISLAGFFTAGWFLSRSYTMALYVNIGMATVVYKLARDRDAAPPPLPFARAARLSLITSIVLVLVVYIIVRIEHLLPH